MKMSDYYIDEIGDLRHPIVDKPLNAVVDDGTDLELVWLNPKFFK